MRRILGRVCILLAMVLGFSSGAFAGDGRYAACLFKGDCERSENGTKITIKKILYRELKLAFDTNDVSRASPIFLNLWKEESRKINYVSFNDVSYEVTGETLEITGLNDKKPCKIFPAIFDALGVWGTFDREENPDSALEYVDGELYKTVFYSLGLKDPDVKITKIVISGNITELPYEFLAPKAKPNPYAHEGEPTAECYRGMKHVNLIDLSKSNISKIQEFALLTTDSKLEKIILAGDTEVYTHSIWINYGEKKVKTSGGKLIQQGDMDYYSNDGCCLLA